VVAAPSGTGKTTVCRAVVERDPGISFSVSHTTRRRREGERDGVDYHFVDSKAFKDLAGDGAFLVWAEYGGNLYGTSWKSLREPLEGGRDILLEIEVQGAQQVRERQPEVTFIFLLPPTLEALEERLRGRGTDDEEVIDRRLTIARRELEAVHIFDYAVVNDQLEVAIETVLEIIHGERAGQRARLLERHGRERVWAVWAASQAEKVDPSP
jgi:guanylate kinase